MSDQPIYIDIDGTLTKHGDRNHQNSYVLEKRIMKLRMLINDHCMVVVWSARGTTYARDFCKTYGLEPLAAIGKPGTIVDDNATVRPLGTIQVKHPDEFFESS